MDLEPGHDLLDIVAIKQDLEKPLGRHLDVVTEQALNSCVRDEVLREAAVL